MHLNVNVKLKWRHDTLKDLDSFLLTTLLILLIILNNEMKEKNPHILSGDDSDVQQ